MGNYIFSCWVFEELFEVSISGQEIGYDFGYNVILCVFFDGYYVQVYDFYKNFIFGQECFNIYWCDVGMFDVYFEVNMDFVLVNFEFDIYNFEWLLCISSEFLLFVKFVYEFEGCKGQVFNFIMVGGVIISGGIVCDSVFGCNVCIYFYLLVESCVLFDDVQVGWYLYLCCVIVDKDVVILFGIIIGLNCEYDEQCGFIVIEYGVVVVFKGYVF